MRDFNNVLVLSVASVALVCGPAHANRQAARAGDSGSRIAIALRFMAAMYPKEIAGTGVAQVTGALYAEMDLREFRILFGARELSSMRTVADEHRAECQGSFRFVDAGLSSFHASGRCVKEAEYAAFQQVAKAHSTWSDDDLARELARRGAAYGPSSRDRLAARLPDASFIAEAVGEIIEPRGFEFDVGEVDDDGKRLSVEAMWKVTYAVPGSWENATVVAWLEPFGGRLKMLLRLPVKE